MNRLAQPEMNKLAMPEDEAQELRRQQLDAMHLSTAERQRAEQGDQSSAQSREDT